MEHMGRLYIIGDNAKPTKIIIVVLPYFFAV
jgi:hypothetical protein